MRNPHVFISYSRQDGGEAATILQQVFQERSIPYWLDMRNINPANDFTAEIEQGIESSSHVIACITRDSKRSDSFVRREIQYALAEKKPVIPLRFEEITPHISIINNERVDYFKDINTAINRIIEIIRGEHYQNIPSTTHADDKFHLYLQYLLKEIKKVIQQKTISGEIFNLTVQEKADAVRFPDTSLLSNRFWDQKQSALFPDFESAFNEHNGRLLLLGNPGSGKTTTLFAFARNMVTKRLDDPTAALPILLSISDWDFIRSPSILEWIEERLQKIRPKIADETIEDLVKSNTKLLLLLDGLDELGGLRVSEAPGSAQFDPRERFLEAIDSYLNKTNTDIVITSRTQDYHELDQKLDLNNAVQLLPLTESQVKATLSYFPTLLSAVERDISLLELCKTPLIMSILMVSWDRVDPAIRSDASNLIDSSAQLRDELMIGFVAERFEREARRAQSKDASLSGYTLESLLDKLGLLAMVNAAGYRYWCLTTDPERETHENSFSDTDFRIVVESQSTVHFIELCTTLNLILPPTETGKFRLIHLFLRDALAYRYAAQEKVFQDNNVNFRLSAITTLKNLSDKRSRTIEILTTSLRDDDRYVRKVAAEALSALNWKPPSFDVELDYYFASQQWQALRTRGSEVFEFLMSKYNDNDPDVRAEIVSILGNIENNRTLAFLTKALSDHNIDIRIVAADLLGRSNNPNAIKPLRDALIPSEQLDDTETVLREVIAKSLEKLGQKPEQTVQTAQQSDSPITLSWAELDDPDKIYRDASLEELLEWSRNDPDPEKRKDAESYLKERQRNSLRSSLADEA